MKIIFSRKGFDSGAGGFPSPIFPNGKLLSLPIPDKNSPIAYKDIQWGKYNLGDIVASITKGKITPGNGAHLDPDIDEFSIVRDEEWRPILGQSGVAQGHLRNQDIGAGDLFLFFGLFQNATINKSEVKLNPNFLPKHVIWGWLQVETSISVEEIDRAKFRWATYHPHFHYKPNKSNTIYLAKKMLDISELGGNIISGAGIFPKFSNSLQLTAPGSPVSVWKLPLWMFPANEASALSYHGNFERWEKHDDYVLLQTVGRGQEFVLDCLHYPEAMPWVDSLFIS